MNRFAVLTKNPDRLGCLDHLPENLWIGTSVEADYSAWRIESLLRPDMPNPKFVSLEPLLGPIDLAPYLGHDPELCGCEDHANYCPYRYKLGLEWVIVGAQTGPGATKPKARWIESIIDQCAAAGIPVFIKRNVGWPFALEEFPDGGVDHAEARTQDNPEVPPGRRAMAEPGGIHPKPGRQGRRMPRAPGRASPVP